MGAPTVAPVTAPARAGRSRSGGARWLRRALLVRDRDTGPESAADRVLRGLGLAIGLVGTIAGLLELPEIIVQHREVPLFWTLVTVSTAFGLLPVLAVVASVARPQLIRPVAGAAALGYLAAMVLVLAYFAEIEAAPGPIWVYRLVAIGVLAAALSWRLLFAGVYLVVAAAFPGTVAYLLLDGTSWMNVLVSFARQIGLCMLLLWCVAYARSAGVRVDRETVRASEQAAAVAGTAARERERARFAALIHDAVLSTLLDASRECSTSPVLREQAQRTLDQLDETRFAESDPDTLDADSAIGFLRSAVYEVNRSVEFTARRGADGATLRIPVEAAGTLAAALAEATRNSLRHAAVPGRAVRRTVTVTVGAGGLQVVVRDDGAGFDRTAVPADRLGVSVSVLGRMRQLPGGAAFVESVPGKGTTVTVVWASGGGDDV
ncbi:sensor histidine kinase [Nocardia sp. NPDC003963]